MIRNMKLLIKYNYKLQYLFIKFYSISYSNNANRKLYF